VIEAFLAGLVGILAGRLSVIWAARLAEPGRAVGITRCISCKRERSWPGLLVRIPSLCNACGARSASWTWLVSLLLGTGFCFYAWMLTDAGCQTVAGVCPTAPLLYSRLPFHLLFIFLLATATLTDLIDYVIPDQITWFGTALAIGFATLSGELQMIHIWVDWNDELVTLYGPYLPQWIKDHQHLHGFAWSVCGGALGAGLMWIARIAAHRILGFPAIGFGDVTLMAMIGSFMGWQPVLCVLTVAPLIGLILGLTAFILTGRSFVAFGPYLCAAAFVVLCTWREIWEVQGLRIIFGHWPTVSGLLSGSLVLYCLLLWGVRILRAVSIQRLR